MAKNAKIRREQLVCRVPVPLKREMEATRKRTGLSLNNQVQRAVSTWLRLPSKLVKQLDQVTQATGLPRSWVIRQILSEFFEDRRAKEGR